jgi:hypothetical protein
VGSRGLLGLSLEVPLQVSHQVSLHLDVMNCALAERAANLLWPYPCEDLHSSLESKEGEEDGQLWLALASTNKGVLLLLSKYTQH